MTDVWTVLDYTWQEGGSVVGVANSLTAAQHLAEGDYDRGPLEWVEQAAGYHVADQGDASASYIVQCWTVEDESGESP